jgi:succinate dehydrogenase/fumarate reductase flavoprotein subunit
LGGGLPLSRELCGAATGWIAAGDRHAAIQASKDAVSPFLHDAPALLRAKRELAEHWQRVEEPSSSAAVGDRLKGREASAMLAAARWIVEAALLRDETRGMHRRSDHPKLAAGAPTRITLSGVHAIVSQTEGRA